mmetsp:Transcript_73357/g.160642  ORF Transcript_73357/g.160642 Transcript_73357/m.160642 type:complete len:432 (+) Transcript_73357:153-1448(+)|eukprot:CAMPEP_0206566880 /NCGR_PEP_ID=MMETSP0325_2-20121206/24917_1 /ASSEMBLY_ACC=CAM_ASM_000347 /TAXON_ID=2866 /ORGANISM="Crypthecodinium cohnii, Strain Seligo" /LENGTH=431 /DNA_ID=CAMNT_0054069985 /DNA_START=71 /DNA_END=1366 /DNA_ORIENTATION=-
MSAVARHGSVHDRPLLLATLWPVIGLPVAAAFKDGLHHEEAKSYDFFGKTTPHGEPHPVPRYKTLTAEEFERLALDGRPFVLEDGGRGQPFVGWSCSRFKEEFPKAVVKIEYVKGDKPIRSMQDDWENELHPIVDADPNGPQYAPWYWGVKGADDKEDRATVYEGGAKNNPFPAVQKLMRIPDYMRNTSDNRREIFGSPEFWFSAPKAGAQMHMDSHCESTMVIQLSGKRVWKLGWTPPVPNNTVYKEGSFADGEIYGKGYHPPLEAVVSEGEALFFPSGFLHSTMNIGDTCAASLTFQFRDPIPARYFRHAMSHLRRTGDFSECWKLIGQVAQASVPKWNHPPEDGKLGEKVDPDGDGRFLFEEAKTRLHKASHSFYDENEDGVVTDDEVADGWAAWHGSVKAAKHKNRKKVHASSFHYLGKTEKKHEEL